MQTLVDTFERAQMKDEIPEIRSGDTVRVHQRITEGSKERVQVFEGVVIRTHRMNSLNATITVRRTTGGYGVEKTFMIHAPNTEKIETMRRGKARRNYLSYLRARTGKSARLAEIEPKGPEDKQPADTKDTSQKKTEAKQSNSKQD